MNKKICDKCGKKAVSINQDIREIPSDTEWANFEPVPGSTRIRCKDHIESARTYHLDGRVENVVKD